MKQQSASTCLLTAAALALTLGVTLADVYLHTPRGSNNRLNERTATRQNKNRMFDSQNNDRGGYNVGDIADQATNNENAQYNMRYFQSVPGGDDGTGESQLMIEWTNQHGCGGNEGMDPHKQNCALVMQFMCQDGDEPQASLDRIRNGQQTNTQNYNELQNLEETANQAAARKTGSVQTGRGLHEQFEWYDKCFARERNAGLFTADQYLQEQQNNQLGYSSAIFTRQNPNGNRNGYECPEERDYYPYWHPSPWRDIAVLTDTPEICDYYQANSFNTRQYGECVELFNGNTRRHYSRYNNPEDCAANGGTWTEFYSYLEVDASVNNQAACEAKGYNWGVRHDNSNPNQVQCLVPVPPVDCGQAPWSRSNHLGNGRDGQANNYTWVLPNFPSNTAKRCAFRFRYNISTDDYNPWTTNATHNQNLAAGRQSPVQQNPYVEIGAGHSPLRLAINTAQFGRTFEDRSHAFVLEPRTADMGQKRIVNLNVRGKRGNIVQTFPAVEYDFTPNQLNMAMGDLMHVQWTGSNSHNNRAPGGDGQTGDAGEGRGGTDRSNLVQMNGLTDNYPVPYENSTLWQSSRIVWDSRGMASPGDMKDLAVYMATSGYYHCFRNAVCGAMSVDQRNNVNNLLNNAPASMPGAVLEMTAPGTYVYSSTRNNNFSNRSQKGSIVVT